jgi:hypothetical protein
MARARRRVFAVAMSILPDLRPLFDAARRQRPPVGSGARIFT